jgi:hypothetical protein
MADVRITNVSWQAPMVIVTGVANVAGTCELYHDGAKIDSQTFTPGRDLSFTVPLTGSDQRGYRVHAFTDHTRSADVTADFSLAQNIEIKRENQAITVTGKGTSAAAVVCQLSKPGQTLSKNVPVVNGEWQAKFTGINENDAWNVLVKQPS